MNHDLEMEELLDLLIAFVEDRDEDDTEAPARAVEWLAKDLREREMPVAAEVWAKIGVGLAAEKTTVKSFRAMTRRTLGLLAAQG